MPLHSTDHTSSGEGMTAIRRSARIFLASILQSFIVLLAEPSPAFWPADPNVNLPIATNLYSHWAPRIVSLGAGGVIIVWEDLRAESNSYDIYAQRVSATGDVLWVTDGVPVTNAPGEQFGHRVVADGSFGAIVAWEDNRSGLGWDVYAQRIGPFGDVLWGSDGVAICTADSDQVGVDIAPDGEGGANIAWTDSRNGPGSDIYSQRVDAQGTVLWTDDGVPVSAASRNQEKPRIVADGAHGAVIVWEDFRRSSTDSDIYAQRISATGSPLWTFDGVTVCDLPGLQSNPQPVIDAVGGIIVAWDDFRFGGDGDIYAQRIVAAGAVAWVSGGVGVCTAVGIQDRAAVMSDA